jgi:hypothetical protein
MFSRFVCVKKTLLETLSPMKSARNAATMP